MHRSLPPSTFNRPSLSVFNSYKAHFFHTIARRTRIRFNPAPPRLSCSLGISFDESTKFGAVRSSCFKGGHLDENEVLASVQIGEEEICGQGGVFAGAQSLVLNLCIEYRTLSV